MAWIVHERGIIRIPTRCSGALDRSENVARVIWAWLAMLVVGSVKPLWRWLQRQRARDWPTVPGQIQLAEARRRLSFSGSPRGGRGPQYVGDLTYRYTLEGRHQYGHYRREFASEEEGREFVHDLEGKSALISYNPRNHAKSLLLEEQVGQLLLSRPPLAEGGFQGKVRDMPGWAKPLLWRFLVLSAVGLGLSLWVHLGALGGRRVAPAAFFWMLHLGIFAVWIPAVLVSRKRVGNARRKDYWKVALRGAPEWMRYMVYGFGGYATVNFLIFVFEAPNGAAGANPPVAVWRAFSGAWMAFYSAALAILYSGTTDDQS